VAASGIETQGARGLSAKELAMAKQLVAMLEDELDLEDYRDEYSARVREFVEKKAKGRHVRPAQARGAAPPRGPQRCAPRESHGGTQGCLSGSPDAGATARNRGNKPHAAVAGCGREP
jgi:hypothetical protein